MTRETSRRDLHVIYVEIGLNDAPEVNSAYLENSRCAHLDFCEKDRRDDTFFPSFIIETARKRRASRSLSLDRLTLD